MLRTLTSGAIAASASLWMATASAQIPSTYEGQVALCYDASKPNAQRGPACIAAASSVKADAGVHYAAAYSLMFDEPRDLPRAIAEFSETIRLDPSDADAWYYRAVARLRLTPPEYDAAIADLDNTLRIRPTDDAAYVERGRAYMTKPTPDFARAIDDFTKGVEIGVGEVNGAYRGRANAYLSGPKPDYQLAYDDFDMLVFKGKAGDIDYYRRGYANLRKPKPDYTEAVDDFTRVIANNPQFYEALAGRADALFRQGDYAGAVADYDGALRLRPAVGVLNMRALAKSGMKDYSGAIADFEIIRTQQPNDPVLLNSLCWNRALLGQELDKALSDCDASLRLRPDNGAALNSRGLVNFRRGDYNAALADYTAAVKANPNDADSWYGSGVARARLGQAQQGPADILTATRIDPAVTARSADIGLILEAP